MLSLVVKVAFVIEKIRAIRLSLADLSNRLGSASLNSSIAKIIFKISISSSWNAEIPLSYFVTTGIYNDSYMVTTEPGHKHWFLKYRFEKIEDNLHHSKFVKFYYAEW